MSLGFVSRSFRSRGFSVAALALATSLAQASFVTAAEQTVLKLWEGDPPHETGEFGPEGDQPDQPGQRQVRRIQNVTDPTIEVFPAPADKANGSAIVICPGGGYNILAWDLEGTEVAERFNAEGTTCIVLKYRVPRRPDQEPHVAPLCDAQRAIRLTRQHAEEWKIDPHRVGVLGFSAGGNLAMFAATSGDAPAYEPTDEADKLSCRPDFALLIYPAYLTDEKGELRSDVKIDKDTPPCFFVHAIDDGVTADSSVQAFRALKKAGVNAELHVYSAGGHGYGLRESEDPVHAWPDAAAAWMKRSGYFAGK